MSLPPPLLRPIVMAFLVLITASMISAQDSPPPSSPTAYPESPEGLKQLIHDVFSAMKSKDNQRVSSYFSSMALPEHTAWFTKTFGTTEGARMDAKYADLRPGLPESLKKIFEYAKKDDRTEAQVSVIEKGGSSSGLEGAAVNATQTPLPLYLAEGSNSKQQYRAAIGDFFYVDGAFRFIPSQVLQALSTAPPVRVRVGGNVQEFKLATRASPVYPAVTAQGSVLLHVILAVDGSVSEVTVISGNPILAKAAVEAVRQWRYKPTMLSGMPVEVDTTVLVEFKR